VIVHELLSTCIEVYAILDEGYFGAGITFSKPHKKTRSLCVFEKVDRRVTESQSNNTAPQHKYMNGAKRFI